MKAYSLSFILLAAIISAGCIPSIHPYYRDEDLVFDKVILGVWSDQSLSESWSFERSGSREYRLEYKDESGRISLFDARIFRSNGRTFIDLLPIRPGFIGDDFYGSHLLSVHTSFAVEIEKCSARMYFLDPIWLKQHLAKHPDVLKHTLVDDEVILTDSTRNLQNFISRHNNTAGAFEETETLFKSGEKTCESNS